MFPLKDVEMTVEKCLKLGEILVFADLLLGEVSRVYQVVEHNFLCFLIV